MDGPRRRSGSLFSRMEGMPSSHCVAPKKGKALASPGVGWGVQPKFNRAPRRIPAGRLHGAARALRTWKSHTAIFLFRWVMLSLSTSRGHTGLRKNSTITVIDFAGAHNFRTGDAFRPWQCGVITKRAAQHDDEERADEPAGEHDEAGLPIVRAKVLPNTSE